MTATGFTMDATVVRGDTRHDGRLNERALALVAYGHSENDLRFDPGVRMRAALRAAWGVE